MSIRDNSSIKTFISNITNNWQCFTCPSKSNIKMSHVKRKTTPTSARKKFSSRRTDQHQQQQQLQCMLAYSHCNFIVIGLIFIIITCNAFVEGALNNVSLIIEPPAVRRGQHALLRCMYDLEGAPLYSAKFYRGQLEFYRYTPGELPNIKVFPFPGIHVDVTSSNASQVLIRNVGFGLSGNFSCEVTADAPLFSTATAFGPMQVVELPDRRPLLFTEHTRYDPGDILRANCSTPPSRPKAELKFTINNMVVHVEEEEAKPSVSNMDGKDLFNIACDIYSQLNDVIIEILKVNNVETQYIRTIDNLIASRISLKLQLQGVHFSSVNPSVYGHSVYGMNSVHGGGLVLRCTATIGELYQEYKEIELGTPQKDPVPARVTLSSGSTVQNIFSFFSSGTSKLSATNTAKLLLTTGIWHASAIRAFFVQLLLIVQILLKRYKTIFNLKKHSQNICAFLRFILLSQR